MTFPDPTEEAAMQPPTTGFLVRAARAAVNHPWRVVAAWLVVLAAVVAIAPRFAGDGDVDFSMPGSESAAASDLVAQRFPGRSGESVTVVWTADGGVRAPAVRARVDRFVDDAARVDGIAGAEPARISPDGGVGMTRLDLRDEFADVPSGLGRDLIDRAEAASGDGLRIELGGGPIRDAEGGGNPEMVGIIAAAIILLLAFGSVVAAGLPLITALVGLGISAPLIGVVALALPVPDFAPAVAGLLGVGVGIDYALLILTRYRAALAAGRDRDAAIAEAVTTSGRSVLIAGGTVVIGVLGLFLVGVSFLQGIAVAASLAVLVVMAASVTLLPAFIRLFARAIDRLRIPGLGRAPRPGSVTLSERWSRVVQRRPWAAAAAGAAILLALTLPVAGLQLGFPDEGNDRAGTTTREAYDLVTRGFGPGANGPLLVAVDLRGADAPAALASLERGLAGADGVAFTTPPRTNPAGDAAIVTVIPETSPQDAATSALVRDLRDRVVPPAVAGTGAAAHVGGVTAAFIDQSDTVAGRLPLFVGAVVLLSFLLLLLAFRAPVIALKAAVMNLLSVGAAYGAVALVAEGGWAGRLVGIDTPTPVPPFIPVMMFAILFGLSMDYEVFLLGRVREEYLRTGRTATAVTAGLAATARVITAAAAIMVAVFLSFVVADDVFQKLIGVGMATAIFVDATVIRMVLVPSVMQLMGGANWWLPGWLGRLLPAGAGR
ncbi:MAG TPA: MMPL family transporter [Miltoncostaeaceae bacterium]|nr:MMPL family transporter [Miltoncostaeaceae bacterium]